MASPITGRNGALYVDQSAGANGSASPVANLNQFSINQTRDKTEVTAFGAASKTYVAGLADASGDFSGFHDTDGSLQKVADGIGRRFYLYAATGDSTKYFFGTATFDITVSSSVGGAVEASGSWSASTPVSYVG